MSRLWWTCYVIAAVWVSVGLSQVLPSDAALVFVGAKVFFLLPACVYIYRQIKTPQPSFVRKYDTKLVLLFAAWSFLFLGVNVIADPVPLDVRLLLYAVATTVVMVTIEELIFRGITFSGVGEGASIRRKQYISSGYFAVLHGFNLLYTGQVANTLSLIIMAFGMGMFLSAVYLRYGRILYPIALHFLVNVVPEYKLLLDRPPIRMAALAEYDWVVDERIFFSVVVAAALTGLAYAVLPRELLRRSHSIN